MAHRVAKFVSAISTGLVVGTPFATLPQQTVQAAEECLTRPRDAAPPGKHWYYHLVRETNGHCWYLHEATETSSHAAMSRRARRAEIVASHKSEPALSQTTANAYAEFGFPDNGAEDTPGISQQTLIASDYPKGVRQDQPNTLSGENPQWVVASRWPEPTGVLAASIEPPPASLAVASAPDAKQDADTADLTPTAPPVVLTSADTPATGTPASLRSLLLATVGAITISGFAGSSVYLLAQRRRRPQSRPSLSHQAGWQSAEWVDRTLPPPWLYREHEAEASAFRMTSDLDDAARD